MSEAIKCVEVLSSLFQKKIAEAEGDKLKTWEYKEMIKTDIGEKRFLKEKLGLLRAHGRYPS